MKIRMDLPLVLLACCLLLAGCKKNAAFLVVDSETNKPLPQTLVDHHTLYEFPDENAGESYLDKTLSLDESGFVEIEKPKKGDTYVFRLSGYQSLKVRMTKPGENAEYLVVGGPKKLEWFALEMKEKEGKDDVPTFVVPLKK